VADGLEQWAAEVRRLALLVKKNEISAIPEISIASTRAGGRTLCWKAVCEGVDDVTADTPEHAMEGMLLLLRRFLKKRIEEKQRELEELQSLENIAAVRAVENLPDLPEKNNVPF
jgi:hypothetical protein